MLRILGHESCHEAPVSPSLMRISPATTLRSYISAAMRLSPPKSTLPKSSSLDRQLCTPTGTCWQSLLQLLRHALLRETHPACAGAEMKRYARGSTCVDRARSGLPYLNEGPVYWRGSDSLGWKLDRGSPLPVALCDGLGSGNGIEPAQQAWRVFLIPFACVLGAAASHERRSVPAIWSPSAEWSSAQQAMYGGLATVADLAHAWHSCTSGRASNMI